jgi:hypothetical protein
MTLPQSFFCVILLSFVGSGFAASDNVSEQLLPRDFTKQRRADSQKGLPVIRAHLPMPTS